MTESKYETENLNGGEEQERPQSRPRRRGTLGRALGLFLLLAVVLGVVAAMAYRDSAGFGSLRRMLSYGKSRPDGTGQAELYSFDSDRSNVFELLGERLLVVSTTRITLADRREGAILTESVKLSHPAVVQGGGLAAVYDVGGEALFLVNEKGALRDLTGQAPGSILSASLSDAGSLTLTTGKSGYKAAVSVYDKTAVSVNETDFRPVFTFNSSDRYVADACALDDGKHLAVVTLGEADGTFASTVTFYSLASETPLSSSTLTGSLVLSAQNLGGKVCALQDDRLTTFAPDGTLAGSYRFDYPYLRGQSLRGRDFAVLMLSQYRSGSALRLVTVDSEGNELGSKSERREILDVSAAGKYVAVLFGDSLSVCSADLTERSTLTGTDYARRVIMREDGSAVLIGASSAWLYLP